MMQVRESLVTIYDLRLYWVALVLRLRTNQLIVQLILLRWLLQGQKLHVHAHEHEHVPMHNDLIGTQEGAGSQQGRRTIC